MSLIDSVGYLTTSLCFSTINYLLYNKKFYFFKKKTLECGDVLNTLHFLSLCYFFF